MRMHFSYKKKPGNPHPDGYTDGLSIGHGHPSVSMVFSHLWVTRFLHKPFV